MIAYLIYTSVFCLAIATPNRPAKSPVPSSEPFAIHFQVRGDYRPTQDEARESTLEKARDELREILVSRGIQRFILPSLDWIDRELAVRKSEHATPAVLEDGTALIQLTIDFKLDSSHIRSFRKMERSSLSAIVVGLLAVVFLASWLYYRLDEWSKGYLTSWLAIGLAAAGIIVGGLWWWLYS